MVDKRRKRVHITVSITRIHILEIFLGRKFFHAHKSCNEVSGILPSMEAGPATRKSNFR